MRKDAAQCLRKLPLHVPDVLDLAAAGADPDLILSLDDAVSRLEQQSPSAAAVVRLRFFAGLTVDVRTFR